MNHGLLGGALGGSLLFSGNVTLTCKLAGGYFPVPPSSLRHNFSTWSPNWETIPSIIKQSESHFPLEQKVARIWRVKH